jgi:hypothetical protein
MDGSHRTPDGEALLGRYRIELVRPLTQGCIVAHERKRQGAE